MEDAIRLNVAALGISVFVGTDYERQSLLNLARLVDEGEKYGIPVMAVTAVGKELGKRNLNLSNGYGKLKEQTQAMLERKKVVESLQSNRTEAVRLMDQLVRQLPDGLYLKSVKQTGDLVNVKIVRIADFGVFVEILPGIEGVIFNSELDDRKVENASELVKVGEERQAKIIKTQDEIECQKIATMITEAGFQALLDNLKPGVKECELLASPGINSPSSEVNGASAPISSAPALYRALP
jgi:predicted RNA-binding protein with RPS1 domain